MGFVSNVKCKMCNSQALREEKAYSLVRIFAEFPDRQWKKSTVNCTFSSLFLEVQYLPFPWKQPKNDISFKRKLNKLHFAFLEYLH